jgi:eukaryotic-like serine/threonine-protein kinase
MNGAGLIPAITEVRPPGSSCGIGNAGTVVAESPAAGTFTALPVNLTVCATTTAVPGVLSFGDASARRAITSAGLTVGSVTMAPSCAALRGEVLTQNPAQDTVVPVGSAVSLTESTGRQPNGKPCPIE